MARRPKGALATRELVIPDEVEELDLLGEAAACRAAGITFLAHPVPDRGLPASPEGFRDLVLTLAAEVGRGSSVAAHCRQGVGRAAMLAAAVPAATGVSATAAFETVAAARGRPVP